MSAAAFVARRAPLAAKGGYGVVMRANARCGAARSFSVAQRFQEKKYAKTHEWVEYSADKKTATIGISKYAAGSLGDIVFVELPVAGDEFAVEDAFGSVESVKSASDLYAPVAGTVIENNSQLEEKPSLINKDAEGEAWIAKLEVTGEEDSKLMDADEYKAFTEEEGDH